MFLKSAGNLLKKDNDESYGTIMQEYRKTVAENDDLKIRLAHVNRPETKTIIEIDEKNDDEPPPAKRVIHSISDLSEEERFAILSNVSQGDIIMALNLASEKKLYQMDEKLKAALVLNTNPQGVLAALCNPSDEVVKLSAQAHTPAYFQTLKVISKLENECTKELSKLYAFFVDSSLADVANCIAVHFELSPSPWVQEMLQAYGPRRFIPEVSDKEAAITPRFKAIDRIFYHQQPIERVSLHETEKLKSSSDTSMSFACDTGFHLARFAGIFGMTFYTASMKKHQQLAVFTDVQLLMHFAIAYDQNLDYDCFLSEDAVYLTANWSKISRAVRETVRLLLQEKDEFKASKDGVVPRLGHQEKGVPDFVTGVLIRFFIQRADQFPSVRALQILDGKKYQLSKETHSPFGMMLNWDVTSSLEFSNLVRKLRGDFKGANYSITNLGRDSLGRSKTFGRIYAQLSLAARCCTALESIDVEFETWLNTCVVREADSPVTEYLSSLEVYSGILYTQLFGDNLSSSQTFRNFNFYRNCAHRTHLMNLFGEYGEQLPGLVAPMKCFYEAISVKNIKQAGGPIGSDKIRYVNIHKLRQLYYNNKQTIYEVLAALLNKLVHAKEIYLADIPRNMLEYPQRYQIESKTPVSTSDLSWSIDEILHEKVRFYQSPTMMRLFSITATTKCENKHVTTMTRMTLENLLEYLKPHEK